MVNKWRRRSIQWFKLSWTQSARSAVNGQQVMHHQLHVWFTTPEFANRVHILDLPRQGGLRDMEARGRTAEMLLLPDRDEIAQIP